MTFELPSPVVGAGSGEEEDVEWAPRLPEFADFRSNNKAYIEQILGPRVRECWREVQGDGEIKLRHTFVIRDGRAYAAPIGEGSDSPVEVVNSTLPEDQDQVAIDCITKSAEGTSFEYVPLTPDAEDETLSIYKTWPSPGKILRERAANDAAVTTANGADAPRPESP